MADRTRDRHIRDSGLPTNDDSLITVRGGDSPSDTDSEELIHNLFHPSTPPANMADPVQPVRPQQIANIPLFDGERGEGFVNWVETLENARDAYDWDIDSLVGVAKAEEDPRLSNG